MEHGDPHESKFDVAAGHLLDSFAQGISRRGILARIGKLALAVMGFSLVPHLPVDRTFVVEAQTTSCDNWKLCGIQGNLCKACCGQNDMLTACPQCTRTAASWTKCCPDTTGKCFTITYTDCCGVTGTDPNTQQPYSDANAAACKGKFCSNNADVTTAYDCADGYRCTVISVGSAC